MIKFERYPHIQDLFEHYVERLGRGDVTVILKNGISSNEQAVVLSQFVWNMVEQLNKDEEEGVLVLGSKDNTDMIPDLSYEVTKHMKKAGYLSVWESVSAEHM